MTESPRILHILTPQSDRSPAELAAAGGAAPGDLIAAFRSFPPLLYRVEDGRACRDVTTAMLETPDYWTVTRQWFQELTERSGLQEASAIAGHGTWWSLNGQRFTPGLSDLGNVFAWIDLLQAVRRAVSVRRIVVHGRNAVLDGVLPQILPGAAVERAEAAAAAARRPARRLSQLGLRFVRVLLGLVYLAYAALRRPQVWFLSSTTLLRAEKVGGVRRLRDVYLGEVEQALRMRGWRTAVVEHHGSALSWPALRVRGFFLPYDLLLLLAHLRLSLPAVGERALRPWRARWAALEPAVTAQLHHGGVDLSPLALPALRRAFVHDGALIESLVGLWRGVLRLCRPRLFYINCSYAQSAVPITIAARSLGVRTVEQQHGIIAASHKGYVVPPALRQAVRVPWCDRMVVWGDYTRRLLVGEGSYRSEHLAVCGFPRIDALVRAQPPRAETLARYGIPPEERVALYTSNMIVGDLYPQILASLKAVAAAPLHWIVKLHPREATRDRWEQAIRAQGLSAVHLAEPDADFYALLAACDLHVSFVSTTLIEAAVMGKPNLGLSWASVPDPVGYAEAGAYLPVDPAQLGETAWALLNDRPRLQAVSAEQRRFAADWCRHDGSSVERIVEFVETLLGAR